jgi:uridine monophosphate synthetase
LAPALALETGRPMIYAGKGTKDYGTKPRSEGEFHPGERVLVIDDVITSGLVKLEEIELPWAAGLTVEDVAVLVERGARAAERLAAAGIGPDSALSVGMLFDYLRTDGLVDPERIASALALAARDT